MRCVRGLKTKIVILAVWSMAVAGVTFHPSLSPTGHHHHGRRHLAGDSSTHYSKWIVVTTVNYPTDTIKTLARVPGWRTVVVADLKTPADWALDGVDFLTVEMQRTLGYSILPLLPNNHYGRKNLGYLWALQHGATLVYETDDDNVLRTPEPAIMDNMEFYVYNATGLSVCNPYTFFGLPHIWPRGYPLDQIKGEDCTSFARQPVRPLILQGMADLDPDVDAIYRLTQKLGVNFEKDVASVVLPEGVMCPWNSQNTLFEREALWGLLIPVTTTFRVCDIWRSYWVQRLLWEVGGVLAFGPPTVDQFRNAHTLLRDFNDELPLYNQTGGLIELLNAWRPPAGADLPAMMVHLGQAMADAQMWAQGDADLMAAWVRDLQAVGYAFPKVRAPTPNPSARPTEPQLPPAPLPRTPQAWRRHRDVILVIVFNSDFPGWLDVYRALREAYRPLFSKIVYTGFEERPPALPAAEAFVTCQGERGSLQYACFANVMQEVPAPPDGGYLIIGDDTVISHCQLAAFNTSKVWFQRAIARKQENLAAWLDIVEKNQSYQHWAYHREGVNTVNAIMGGFREGAMKNRFGQRIRAKLGTNLNEAHFGGDFTDGLYIPARLSVDFQVAAVPFRQRYIFHEIAIPAILGIITDGLDDFEVFKPLYFWNGPVKGVEPDMGRERVMANPDKVLVPEGLAGNAFLLHPYKIGQERVPGAFWAWWQNTSCAQGPALPQDWPGTIGIGVGEWAAMLENRGARYNNIPF